MRLTDARLVPSIVALHARAVRARRQGLTRVLGLGSRGASHSPVGFGGFRCVSLRRSGAACLLRVERMSETTWCISDHLKQFSLRLYLVHHGKTDVPVDTECTSTVCFPQFAIFVCRAVQSLPTMVHGRNHVASKVYE